MFVNSCFKGINQKHAIEMVFLAVQKEIFQMWIHLQNPLLVIGKYMF